MPDPFERHARETGAYSGWTSRPPRSALRAQAADDDPVQAKVPGRKDPGRCKANSGGAHVPETAFRDPRPEDEFRARCRWGPLWSLEEQELTVAWYCEHERHCKYCGLVFTRRVSDEDCPAYPGTEEQRAVAGQQAFERNEARRAMPRRKPVITGRQGYRKRKGNLPARYPRYRYHAG